MDRHGRHTSCLNHHHHPTLPPPPPPPRDGKCWFPCAPPPFSSLWDWLNSPLGTLGTCFRVHEHEQTRLCYTTSAPPPPPHPTPPSTLNTQHSSSTHNPSSPPSLPIFPTTTPHDHYHNHHNNHHSATLEDDDEGFLILMSTYDGNGAGCLSVKETLPLQDCGQAFCVRCIKLACLDSVCLVGRDPELGQSWLGFVRFQRQHWRETWTTTMAGLQAVQAILTQQEYVSTTCRTVYVTRRVVTDGGPTHGCPRCASGEGNTNLVLCFGCREVSKVVKLITLRIAATPPSGRRTRCVMQVRGLHRAARAGTRRHPNCCPCQCTRRNV